MHNAGEAATLPTLLFKLGKETLRGEGTHFGRQTAHFFVAC